MKILLIHASAGAGHTKAAEAIYDVLKKNPRQTVTLIDSLEYTNRFFGKLYRWGYSFLVTKMPAVWGIFFVFVDLPFLQGTVRFLRRVVNGINAKALNRFVITGDFDWVIVTHFLAAEVMGFLKRKGLLRTKLMIVITDFDVHRIWLSYGVDYYAVACEDTKEKLKKLGVMEERIIVSGIPTHQKFLENRNRDGRNSKKIKKEK